MTSNATPGDIMRLSCDPVEFTDNNDSVVAFSLSPVKIKVVPAPGYLVKGNSISAVLESIGIRLQTDTEMRCYFPPMFPARLIARAPEMARNLARDITDCVMYSPRD